MSILAPEGYPFVFIPATAGVLAWIFGFPVVACILWGIALACAWFFRDPKRSSTASAAAILSPADGKVLSVGPSPEKVATLGLPQQVSIFMSPLNVHVNRAPISGSVSEARHTPGAKLPAFRDKASELNEHSFVILQGTGVTVAYKQIAGAVARRVVCDLKTGDTVERGQRVGIIKFGSRVDLFLPAGVNVLVTPGERTKAGVTEIARLGEA